MERNYLTSKLPNDNLVQIISTLSLEQLKTLVQTYPELQCNEVVWLKLLQLLNIDCQYKTGSYYTIYLSSFYETIWTGYIEEDSWNQKETLVARTLDDLFYKIGLYIIRNGRINVIKTMIWTESEYRQNIENLKIFQYFLNYGYDLNYFFNVTDFRTMDNDLAFYKVLANYIRQKALTDMKRFKQEDSLTKEFILATPEGDINIRYQQHDLDM